MLERLNMYINKREMVVINAKLALKLEKNKLRKLRNMLFDDSSLV